MCTSRKEFDVCILYTVQYIKMEIGGCKREIWFIIINRAIGDLKGGFEYEKFKLIIVSKVRLKCLNERLYGR